MAEVFPIIAGLVACVLGFWSLLMKPKNTSSTTWQVETSGNDFRLRVGERVLTVSGPVSAQELASLAQAFANQPEHESKGNSEPTSG